jgi:hypothetical protein
MSSRILYQGLPPSHGITSQIVAADLCVSLKVQDAFAAYSFQKASKFRKGRGHDQSPSSLTLHLTI